jgi:DNA-binding MarR family transcriptional regulator
MTTREIDIPGLCYATKLRRAARRVTRFYDLCVTASGLRITQYAILGHLKHHGPKSMLELAELMTMDRATIGHNLRPLDRDGLVKIETGSRDRRVRMVSVTDAGVERLALGRPGWVRAQAEFESEFGAMASRAMCDTMDRVVACDLSGEDPRHGP